MTGSEGSVLVQEANAILAQADPIARKQAAAQFISQHAGSMASIVPLYHLAADGTFVFTDDADAVDVAALGRALETNSLFPERCNIEFASLMGTDCIRTRVWERGSGITLACGTGACATAVAATLTGRAGRKSTVVMDGGALEIEAKTLT